MYKRRNVLVEGNCIATEMQLHAVGMRGLICITILLKIANF